MARWRPWRVLLAGEMRLEQVEGVYSFGVSFGLSSMSSCVIIPKLVHT